VRSAEERGQIVVNASSPPRRRRYTVAHELGHFLNERHRPTIDFGFACTADDMSKPPRTGRHQQQETEANIFAIEVLTPRSAIGSYLRPPAELDHALAMTAAFEISREAAIRRYVAVQGECLAAVFSKDGRVRYIEKSEDFPATTI
jgi:Zn-dependent peptidase ImmA (M78 family)